MSNSSVFRINLIDEFRGYAIILVLLFHLDLSLFRNGFLGVELFFVLSGFLMYEIYGLSILQGRVSINYFLLKRAARLIPLTCFIIFLTVVFSFLTQNNELSKSIYKDGLFAILGIANLHFWQQTDYFSLPVESVPLLHLWSLSLEMQFYLFFACHLFMLKKYKKADYFFRSCQIIAGSSILIYLATAQFASANYYLLPARLWQFYTGIILAWLLGNKAKHIPRFLVKSSFPSKYLIISLVLLTSLINISVFSLQMIFILLFACIFLIGKLTEKNNLDLLDKLFANIGRASFTLYVLHLPLIFALQTFFGPLNFWTIKIYFFYFLVLAPTTYMTYKLIEGKVYRRLLSNTRRYVLAHISFGIFIILITIAVLNSFSFVSTKNRELFEQIAIARNAVVEKNECQFNFKDSELQLLTMRLNSYLQNCVSTRQKFLVVLGDSHATDLFNSIAVNFPGRAVIDFSVPGCRVTSPECSSQYQKAVSFVNENTKYIESIFYHSKGSYFFIDHDKYPLDQVLINGTINYLKKFPEVIWIGPQAEPRINLLMINRQNSFPKKFHSRQQNLQIQLLDQELRKRSINMGVTYYSLEENIKYNFYEDYLHNGKFTYSDEDHWSAYGEEYFGQKFLKDLIPVSD